MQAYKVVYGDEFAVRRMHEAKWTQSISDQTRRVQVTTSQSNTPVDVQQQCEG